MSRRLPAEVRYGPPEPDRVNVQSRVYVFAFVPRIYAMTMESATIMHRYGNLSVVQMPGRQLPALAIQGDALLNAARQLQRLLANKDTLNINELREVSDELTTCADYYLSVLKQHHISSPRP